MHSCYLLNKLFQVFSIMQNMSIRISIFIISRDRSFAAPKQSQLYEYKFIRLQLLILHWCLGHSVKSTVWIVD